MRHAVALALAVVAAVATVVLARRARAWNEELAIAPPLAQRAPVALDPHTPPLSDRVVLVVIDGLGAGEAALPFLDELRARGVAATARVPYPTVSRPNYVTILTGVPPRDSGVRANRVLAPVAVDTIMTRLHAAGLRAVTASDYGSLASLFAPGAFDDVRHASSIDDLAPLVPQAGAALVAVLVLDVDRAGHAAGVGERYRAAARDVDRMLRGALGRFDPAHETIVITADHGHVARGGHGGTEREVSAVPLVLAGRGIRAGAIARDARLIDVAPTIAALLGVPAPGHAEGRALVELLELDPADAARRSEADVARTGAIAAAIHPQEAGPEAARLAVALAGLALAVGAAAGLRRSIALTRRRALAGAIAPVGVLAAMLAATRGQLSPSFVPSLDRVLLLGGIALPLIACTQLAAIWLAIRRAPDRLAAASGCALASMAIALGAVGLARAWWSPPFYDVPPPAWMVLLPTLDLAAATAGVATALGILLAVTRPAGSGNSG